MGTRNTSSRGETNRLKGREAVSTESLTSEALTKQFQFDDTDSITLGHEKYLAFDHNHPSTGESGG